MPDLVSGTEGAKLYSMDKKTFQLLPMKIFKKSKRSVSTNISMLSLVLLILLGACVTTKEATYLQEYEDSTYTGEYVPPEDYLIKPNDNLYIRVTSLDPALAIMFNAMGDGGAMRGDEASNQLMSYPVELDGTVDLPYVGAVPVAGMTLLEAKSAIATVLEDYLRDASLTVKLVNNYVSILGEVRAPGMFIIYKERLNIFEALAMAGDLADFSDRYVLAIIRQTNESTIVKEFDITDRNIIDSEYFYVMPNDVIYVKPKSGRYFAANTAPFLFAFSAIAALGTLVLLIQNTRLLSQ